MLCSLPLNNSTTRVGGNEAVAVQWLINMALVQTTAELWKLNDAAENCESITKMSFHSTFQRERERERGC